MNNKLHSELIKKAMFPDLGCSEFRELTARKAMRITPMRMMVYHFIRCAEDKGISAYQILDQLKSYNPNAKPTTVYRTLVYLQQAGVIVKIESCSKFVKKNSFPHEGLTLFMICSNCGTIIQHTDSKIQYYVEDKSHEYGYIMQRKDIEISIICPGCQANEKMAQSG
ncbi:transcriptional repressor (plasmid) [Klebsiella pneumoniae]